MKHPQNESDRESKQADADDAQEQLLAPISRMDLREEQKTLIDQIAEACGQYQHEKTDTAARKYHYCVNSDYAEYATHTAFGVRT
jgi:hypothetical protein